MKLGFAVKVLGQPNLKSHDTRRWQNEPHLSVSLVYLRDIFVYLRRRGIQMYRLSSDLAPYVTHPDMPHFHRQIEECTVELAAMGEVAREAGLRLSFHPAVHVVLNAPDESIAARSAEHLIAQARMLDIMGLGPEAVVVVHVGGVYEDKAAAMERFVARYGRLPEATRCRLALENDDSSYSIHEVYRIHQATGMRLVFDHLHFLNHNPEGLSAAEALTLALNTWPPDVTPKIHFSSPRTEMRIIQRADRGQVLRPPLWTQHADFVNPFEFIAFLRATGDGWDFDVMLEVKGKDLALLRLRQDLERLAPDLAARLPSEARERVRESPPAWDVALPPEGWPEEDEEERGEGEELVLVAVMNNRRDFEVARDRGWYRVPLKRAPRRIGADYLAFYQTKAFGPEKWAVNYYAPIRRYRIVTRAELLPEEADHPRANDRYYKVEIGPLQRLPRPIPSRRLRRITFIPTTLRRLLSAQEINDLWCGGPSEETLWEAFKRNGLDTERRYVVREARASYEVDFAIFCREGQVAVACSGDPSLSRPPAEGWSLLWFTLQQLEEDLPACVAAVNEAVERLGGSGDV
jgi:UV DNA damage endonuclease